jgi:hypothetical protein
MPITGFASLVITKSVSLSDESFALLIRLQVQIASVQLT